MAKVTKTVVDKALRDEVFNDLFSSPNKGDGYLEGYKKINERQYGVILTDLNGEQRYVRIGAIVAELREDMTAEELMQKEIMTYNDQQSKKAAKAKANEEKIARDKERRARKAVEKEAANK